MTSPTWTELGARKIGYVCRHGIENWEYCRTMADHMRWMEQAEQWTVAVFVGVAFLLLSLVVGLIRRRPTVVPARVAPRIGTVAPLGRPLELSEPIAAGALTAA